MPPEPLKSSHLAYIAAPMVDQSDLPFRVLARRYGFTLTYTQMWIADRIVRDSEYRTRVLADLGYSGDLDATTLQMDTDTKLMRPVVVQLAGNDPETMLRAARVVEPYCDAIDINLGCPQSHAKEGHFGGYLLGRKDWPLVESIVETLYSSLSIAVHVKLRLCNPATDTPPLALNLAKAGASVIALHARHVAATRRRSGPALLQWVRKVKETLEEAGLSHTTRVVSNGNVQTLDDCAGNMGETKADGLMIGEALLKDPTFLKPLPNGQVRHPRDIAVEYLDLCTTFPTSTASPYTIRQHLKSFFLSRPSFSRSAYAEVFQRELQSCESPDDFRALVQSEALNAAWP